MIRIHDFDWDIWSILLTNVQNFHNPSLQTFLPIMDDPVHTQKKMEHVLIHINVWEHSTSSYPKRIVTNEKNWIYETFKYHKNSKYCLFVPNFTSFFERTFKWTEWSKKIKYKAMKQCPFMSWNIKVQKCNMTKNWL